MAVKAKVYLAIAGWEYEGFDVLGVYRTKEKALAALNEHQDYYRRDYEEIQVFTLNGERLHDDPDEMHRRV